MMDRVEQWKDKISYQSGLLAAACGLAALLLVGTEVVTRPVIAMRISEDQNALLDQVLGGKLYANDVFRDDHQVTFQGQIFHIYEVKNAQGQLTHHVIKGDEEGYSGPIKYLIGVDLNGVIQGVRIISHTETPGLGDKIELEKSNWVLSFNQRSLRNTPVWAVKKDGGDFDQFSGATITPRSVVRGIHKAMSALSEYQGMHQAQGESHE
ncbi:Electron transport complex protein RnfG [Vibrio aerogenes CECT 7868]|uniref:Ion-translocating oxidoreductase complex subunit G n=1 Tax=Vibrio aerogenes CECT 7868 TaxID=1216006 RepID=A0A1M5WWB4_9VIBR|nr:RnfABCDGE type electron transport complex subunit G [Vibrio aerogenes]SHH91750.1 Electron transport complex protein RnfG [Vibrio aerogenes CECT 7868]